MSDTPAVFDEFKVTEKPAKKKLPYKNINDAKRAFETAIHGVIQFVSDKDPDMPQLRTIASIMTLFIDSPEYTLYEKCWKRVLSVQEHVVNRDVDFFLQRDYRDMIKPDQDETIILELVDTVKSRWDELTTFEKNKIWDYGRTLVRSAVTVQIFNERAKKRL
jgi:hypothetical protein